MTIKELYVWCVDDPTEAHGIIAFANGDTPMQAVTSKLAVADKMRPIAFMAAQETGLPVRLYRLEIVEILETITRDG